MATVPDNPPFDIREQLARIDKMRAETLKVEEELHKVLAETRKANSEALKVQQDTKLAPYTLLATGAGAAAALMGAGAALVKLFG